MTVKVANKCSTASIDKFVRYVNQKVRLLLVGNITANHQISESVPS